MSKTIKNQINIWGHGLVRLTRLRDTDTLRGYKQARRHGHGNGTSRHVHRHGTAWSRHVQGTVRSRQGRNTKKSQTRNNHCIRSKFKTH